MKWEIKNNRLTQEFDFKNQTELATFMLEIAKRADTLDHHPDMTITKCSHLKIELFTHTENKVSDLDFNMSEIINSIYVGFMDNS
jgi:4a-hydroxytetrahydrobiopterin dehydratase